MGLFDKFFSRLKVKNKVTNVICIGLDNSGKTSIINQLKSPSTQVTNVTPTVGFKVEKFLMANIDFTVFDMSGQGRYRTMWVHYFKEAEAVIFVIDSADKMRMSVVKDELDRMLNHSDFKNQHIPILFFANKMDVENSLSAGECSQILGLDAIKDKPWQICATNATTGEGIEKGMEWLSGQLLQSA